MAKEKENLTASDRLPDTAVVVRAGVPTGEKLVKGSQEHRCVKDLFGFSVQCEDGLSAEKLAAAGDFRNNQIGITKVRRIRKLGYDVVRSPGNGYHGTVEVPRDWSEADAQTLADIFTVKNNPAKKES